MRVELDRTRQYLGIKWFTLLVTFVAMAAEFLTGIMAGWAAVFSFGGLLIVAVTNLLLWLMTRAGRTFLSLIYFSLFLDLVVITAGSYLTGGPENPWWFLPAFVIFIAGYVLNTRSALLYAAVALTGVGVVFYAEYQGLVPHFPVNNLPEAAWKSLNYLKDYFTGMGLLYFSAALISGYFNRLLSDSIGKLRNSLQESESVRDEIVASRRALLNIMEDLEKERNLLDRRVRERTAQLEGIKANLETLVEERTADLEKSRRAIQHMMKNLREDMEKMKALDKMKTEFLSVISHELRTPMTPIRGYLSLLTTGKIGNLSSQQNRILEIISKQSDHLMGLIDNVLDITRFEAGKPIPTLKEPVSVLNLLNETISAMKVQAEESALNITADLQADLPTILGDAAKLRRVFTNLLGNALKFTLTRGRIVVRAFTAENEIRVDISDNGIGIAAENLEKIFEKFFQVDTSITRAAGGIGMGLPIAREIVKLHGGKIWAESEGLGKGSKFVVTFPVG